MKKISGLLAATLLVMATAAAQKSQERFTWQSRPVGISVLPELQQNGQAGTLIGATPEMLEKYVPGGIIPSAVNAFVVFRYGQVTLIDAGFGTNLFDHLQSFGLAAEDVAIILLTHLHGDHIGGMLRDGQVAFPYAAVCLSQQEHDYWTSDEAMNKLPESRRGGFANARKVIAAYRNQMYLFNPAPVNAPVPVEIIPGVRGIAAFGHTPGHTMYQIDLNGQPFLVWADLTHATPVQMPHPEVAVTYDVDPVQAVATRKEILAYAAKHAMPVAGSHIAFPGAGWVFENKTGGYVFQPVLTPEAVQEAVSGLLEKYPDALLPDIYKHFFQDYFGPGHLISDTLTAKNYLRQELDSYSEPQGPAVEATGSAGNFYRVNLSVLKENKIPFDPFFEAFLESAGSTDAPPVAVWTAQWNRIARVLDDMNLNLPNYEADKAAIHEMLSAGRFASHHSAAYLERYKPHYRIISKTVFEQKLKKYLPAGF
jgi:glyoxylase-like metal-dependent hydrolase (beta-lactamase superfamily II)